MNVQLLIIMAAVLGVLLVVVLLRARRLRLSLEYTEEENLQLRQVIQRGASVAQRDLETLRRLRHDLRHYLRTADGSSMPDEMSAVLNRALEQPLASSGAQNLALESLEHYYRSCGEELGFQTDIRLNLPITQGDLLPDLCLVVSNLLENGVEALQREKGGWLRARSVSTSGYFSLVVGNTCTRPLRSRNGHYLSSKREGRIGVGLATVQEIVRKYGGSSEFTADGEQFRAYVFLPCPVRTEQSVPGVQGAEQALQAVKL